MKANMPISRRKMTGHAATATHRHRFVVLRHAVAALRWCAACGVRGTVEIVPAAHGCAALCTDCCQRLMRLPEAERRPFVVELVAKTLDRMLAEGRLVIAEPAEGSGS